jgi:hypothetical protein
VPGVLLGEAEPKLVDQQGEVHEQTSVRCLLKNYVLCEIKAQFVVVFVCLSLKLL